jgi:two-component system sensor histidine kinase DesK
LVLATMSAQLIVDALAGHAAEWVAAASVAGIVALVALQLYHSTAWRERARPRGWRLTLSAQLLLTSLGFFPVLHPAIHGLGGFVAGSALLLLPGRWGWTAFGGIQVAIAAHVAVLPGRDATDVIFTIMGTVTTGLVVYGLSRLTGLALELDAVRRELARSAVLRERMRVARDTHDLLGLGLSAIALKCDLASRLIGRDDAKARDEVRELVRLTARSRAEVRSVTSDRHHMSLGTELDAACEVLASADVAADVRDESPAVGLPDEIGVVLATVLREAVTNVLRHAEATRCEIELTSDEEEVRLRVANDGVTTNPDKGQPREQRWRAGGHGLANLSARAVAVGGHLSTHIEGGRFEFIVTIPRSTLPSAPVPLGRSPGWALDQEP